MRTILQRLALAGLFFGSIASTNVSATVKDEIDAVTASWIKQAPIPTWFNLQGVAALSANECWIASAPLLGDVGELAHTTDAGRNWTVVSMPRQVNAIAFVDPLHGWAAGNAFFHTTNGGATWIQDNPFGTIYDLFFLDTQHGWAAGNGAAAYYTTDGGLHWTGVATGGDSTIGSIYFTDLLNGWVIDLNGHTFKSTDGGKSWKPKATVSGFNMQMIQFFDALEGWAIGGDSFFHTTDGGNNWTQSLVPVLTWAYGARFFDRLNGVAVGEYGNILRTVDGGVNWQVIQQQGTGQRLWDVEFADANNVFLVGDNGVISRSTNAGASWKSIQSGGAAVTHEFDAIDAKRAWAGQDAGEIAYTVNGGRQWLRAVVGGFDVFGKIFGVAFADASTGWAGGTNPFFGGSRGPLSKSTDGGKTWEQQFESADFTFNGVEAIDSLTAFAVGGFDFVGGGFALRTTDGGISWVDVSPVSAGFRGVFFFNANIGWVVGPAIYKTTNGGDSWTQQFGTGDTEFTSISFFDPQNGWAVGFNNLVLRTTNGGQTWVSQNVGAPPITAITGVSAVNATTGWIVGWKGFVAGTKDGGTTWRHETIPGTADVDFEDTLFLDQKHGWVGGNIGIWMRR